MRHDHFDQPVLDSYLRIHQPGSSSGNRPSKSSGNLFPVWAIGMTLGGRTDDTTDDGACSQRPYDFAIIAPWANASHRWRVPASRVPWKILYFLLNPAPGWLGHIPFPEVLSGIYILPLKGTEIASQVRGALLAAHRVLHSRWPNRHELGMNFLEQAVLWAEAAVADQTHRTDPRILRATEYLMQHWFEPLRLEPLCRHVGLSQSRLLHLFQKETGTTPRLFAECERFRRAQNLLRYTDKPIKEIAAMLGYKYTPHFARRFRRCAGLAPLQFRRRQGRGGRA
jgi:AraC family transcriptional regulator, arabinose operon regulatory protein